MSAKPKELSVMWQATNSIRWVEMPSGEKKLQQAWLSDQGEIDWKDIPVVKESDG